MMKKLHRSRLTIE